jgi:GNAT superfamily N-acetyltransferase
VTVVVRPARADDEDFLREIVYLALYVPDGGAPFPPDIVRTEPRLAALVDDFGSQPLDHGVVALDGPHPIGAAWVRLVDHGYGYVADDIPEMTIAVVEERRGQGVGTLMLLGLMSAVELHSPGISLSVDRRNPARHLYQRFDFHVDHEEPPDTLVMVRRFDEKELPALAPLVP